MLCKDLIDKLNQFNPNANVTTSISEDIALSYIVVGGGQNQREYSKSDTPQIFIEPFDCLCCVNYDGCEEHDLTSCETSIMEWIG